jgi:hypothetical protein
MRKSGYILFLILAAPLHPILQAFAGTIPVNCNEGMTVGKAVSRLNPQENNTIQVTGTCKENIAITGFVQLSIVGVKTKFGPATIKPLSGGFGFWIQRSNIQLSGLTIDGGDFGVVCRDFGVCNFSGNTVENATNVGVWLDNADGTFYQDVIQNNINYGLQLSASRARLTQLTVTGTSAGPDAPGNGVEVDANSTITTDQLTVTGNQGAGIQLIGNSHLVNQFWVGPLTVNGNTNGGIWITENSSADVSGATVTSNTGAAGVVITGNSEASFWSGGTFTGNPAGDVYCGPLNGIAASPQSATIGTTNCPHTYQ